MRVIVKGKLFQLPLPEEVSPDLGTARRSTITGNLVLTLPKVKQVIRSQTTTVKNVTPAFNAKPINRYGGDEGRGLSGTVDIRNIVGRGAKEKREEERAKERVKEVTPKQRSGSAKEYDFDESEVPPLE